MSTASDTLRYGRRGRGAHLHASSEQRNTTSRLQGRTASRALFIKSVYRFPCQSLQNRTYKGRTASRALFIKSVYRFPCQSLQNRTYKGRLQSPRDTRAEIEEGSGDFSRPDTPAPRSKKGSGDFSRPETPVPRSKRVAATSVAPRRPYRDRRRVAATSVAPTCPRRGLWATEVAATLGNPVLEALLPESRGAKQSVAGARERENSEGNRSVI